MLHGGCALPPSNRDPLTPPVLRLAWQTLCDAYVDPNLTDKGGTPFVRYDRLVEEVEGVFGVRGLERNPECDVNASVKAAQVCFFRLEAKPSAPRGGRATAPHATSSFISYDLASDGVELQGEIGMVSLFQPSVGKKSWIF